MITLLAAVLTFTGCVSGDTSGVNVFSGGSRVLPGGTGSAKSSDVDPVSAGVPQGSVQTMSYTLDPENPCTITVENNMITVRGKQCDVLTGVMEGYPKMRTTYEQLGDDLVFTLTPKTDSFDKKYGAFYIIDNNNYKNKVYLELTEDGVKLPDVSELVRNNENAVSSPETLAEDAVARYITLDGSRRNIPQVLKEIKKISDSICEGIDSDYDKLRAIMYWTAENIYYDHPAYNKGIPQECLSLEYMLNNKSSVCGGYSNMTSALCAAQGIRCYNITGRGITDEQNFLQNLEGLFHEWNIAEIDGRRIIVDSGWSSVNTFRTDGTFGSNPINYGYFDMSPELFSLTHKAQTAEYRDYFALLED